MNNKECIRITIAALLTVHNRCAKTIACLSKLFSQNLSQEVVLDVYMVDDGCTDGTANAVKLQFPQVHVISADGSLFWNRGMHMAWENAAAKHDYDYYLWLNDDTELIPNALNQLLSLSAVYDDKAIMVGATQNKQGDKLTYGGRMCKRIPSCDGKPHEAEHFNGNIVLVPHYVYHILGNLDYYYHHSKGDFDYGIRARKHGIKIYQCGEVLGVCDAHTTIDSWCNPAIKFRERWSLMHLPNGMPPKEVFHLEKQSNMLLACFHYITTYLHCLFPRMWVKLDECKLRFRLL